MGTGLVLQTRMIFFIEDARVSWGSSIRDRSQNDLRFRARHPGAVAREGHPERLDFSLWYTATGGACTGIPVPGIPVPVYRYSKFWKVRYLMYRGRIYICSFSHYQII